MEREEQVLTYLREHNIAFTCYHHPEGKTIEEAKTYAIKLAKEKPWCRRAVNVYKCAHCNQYHIGHESSLTISPIFSVHPLAMA
jgi:hypothetical protein